MKRQIVIGAVAALVAAGAVAYVIVSRLPGPAPCAVASTAPPGPRGRATAAPDGGAVRVVEQGFTDELNGGVSYGAILANTSTSIAYRTRVTFTFSRDGQVIEPASPDSGRSTQEIPVIMPGQRVGVGTFEPLPSPGTVSAAELRLGDTTWLTPAALGAAYKPIAATVERTEHPNAQHPGYYRITFAADAPACSDLDYRGAGVILRDASGTIIGGALSLSPGAACMRTRGTGLAEPGELLPVADDSRTQVFPYCDVAPAADPDDHIAN
ncbi:hypothetical protein [Dactylosporangium sp. CA-233914]|uniref:hypothetical protein n=1 Tax=Dactylosporangium sp. CA-233914 TaxID=3239934 RepID=UPI003D89D4B0